MKLLNKILLYFKIILKETLTVNKQMMTIRERNYMFISKKTNHQIKKRSYKTKHNVVSPFIKPRNSNKEINLTVNHSRQTENMFVSVELGQ
jgi:hypothetical protein